LIRPSGLIAVIFALALSSCAPPAAPPPAPAPPEGGPALRIAQVCLNGGLANVPFLAVPFDPTLNTTPQPDTTIPINADIQSDLTGAFNSAPALQPKLCGLDGIFIDPTGCARPSPGSSYDPNTCTLTDDQIADQSWGLRIFKSGPDFGKRYIAISLGLWNNGSGSQWSCQGSQTVCAPPFITYQTRLLRALLPRIQANAKNWTSQLPEFVSASPNTGVVTVLTALAHEFGHVDWYGAFVTTPGQDANQNNSCKGSTFYSQNSPWSGTPPPNRWIAFGKTRDHDSMLNALITQLRLGHFPKAGDELYKIFTHKSWVDAIAAISPDEDFVETEQFLILTDPSSSSKLQHLVIQIYGTQTYPQYDLVSDIQNKPELKRKMNCF